MGRMALPRFRMQSLDGGRLTLVGDEAHHALRVRRLRAGDEIVLFDGHGEEVHGRVAEIDRGTVVIDVLARRAAPEGRATLTLAVAMPKGPRGDWLVEKAAEFGVAALLPLRTQRSVFVPTPARLERWQRKCVAAAKQCGALYEMRIRPPLDLATVIAEMPQYNAVLLADPSRAVPSPAWPNSVSPAQGAATLAIVGPEGGFTPRERDDLVAAGARPVRLAQTTLRVETAALAMAAVWAMSTVGDPS
jgi:16S rRNA (uracil1498-N3)-methyltransferase